MNERIKLLADQAELTVRTSIGTYMSHPEFNQKFAELIVRECVLISRTSIDGFSAGKQMEEHFGVKE